MFCRKTCKIVYCYKSFNRYEEVQRRKSGECKILFSSVEGQTGEKMDECWMAELV